MSPRSSRFDSTDHAERDGASEEEDTPLDRRLTIAIWFNQLASGVYITLPYTLAVYMVRHFEGSASSEESIGRNTGLLAATASAAQCMTSFFWGTVSDRTGRKPVLMIGNIAACLSILALGVAPSYKVAIASRFIGGLFTSAIGVAVKTIIAESCDATNQAKLMGYMTAGWGVGTIVGPTIGGLLARPCTTFASGLSVCHEGSLLMDRPFLLPCLVTAVMAAMAWLSNLFMMTESHPRFRAVQYASLKTGDVETTGSARQTEEVQMSLMQHRSPKADESTAATHNIGLLSSSDRSLSVPVDATSPAALHWEVHQANRLQSAQHEAPVFASAQSATQESQLQLTASDSSSSSSGILAVRSASTPLDLLERSDHDRLETAQQVHQLRRAKHAQHPKRAPSLELILPESGGDSDMAAYPGALEVAAEKADRLQKLQSKLPSRSPEHKDRTSHLSYAGSDMASEQGSETEHLLSPQAQTATESSDECVVDISLHDEVEKPWYRQRLVMVCLGAGGLITLFMNYLDELAPIFASAKISAGGLSMPENEFAWPLTFGGVVLMLYSLFLYPQNQKRWGQLNCCKIGLLLSIPASFVFPAASMFANVRWLAQAFMFTAVGIRSIAKIQALSSSTILVNTVAPMKQIGAVNGASQTLNALARAVGPFIAGIVWGFSADSSIPGKQYYPFLGSVVGILGTCVVYVFIRLPSK